MWFYWAFYGKPQFGNSSYLVGTNSTHLVEWNIRKLSCNFQRNKCRRGYEWFWNHKHTLLCSQAPESHYRPTAGLTQKNDGYLSSFLTKRQAARHSWGPSQPATYIKCSVGWNSSPHMLKRQPWMRESSVLYSAHNGNYRASLHKDQWWLIQKAIHLLKKVLGHEPWVQVFPTWKLLCTLSCHSASGKMLKWICMHQKHAMKM